ncbi:MAG: protein-L-isoaspartate(D-aspartate) O-methyltransferase [Candidatus Omnitrophota bacterium]
MKFFHFRSEKGRSPDDWKIQREAMVEDQIVHRGIRDSRVLQALRRIERHRFVPGRCRREAYTDQPLSIGHGQTISQPYIVALMTELLRLRGGERILEIGTGSGYQTAVLAELGAWVYSLERCESLAEEAKARLAKLGYGMVRIEARDGYTGWVSEAPFDGILVTAAVEEIPSPWIDQLKIDGVLIVPRGPSEGVQQLMRMTKTGHGMEAEAVELVRFVPFIHPSTTASAIGKGG